MCFYTSNSKRAMALTKRYGIKQADFIEIAKEIIEEQYKITAFTHPSCAIITDTNKIETAKWGLIPHQTKSLEEANKIKKMCLNARAETVFDLPSFCVPIMSERCLIPVTGFFEFHHSGKSVIPYYIFLKEEEIFSLGGLYDCWENPATHEISKTFTVITTPANELCAQIHNGGKNPFRMPLIISRKDEYQWLDKSMKTNDIQQFFKPFDKDKMTAYPVSKDFIKKSPDDPSIIEKAA